MTAQSSEPRSWIDRIANAFSGEPKDREELVNLLRDAQQRELFDAQALKMLEGVLQVSEMRVNEIMVPRSEMIVIDKSLSLEKILPIVISSAHSRFPVIGDSKDEVIGILLAKDLLAYTLPDQQKEFNLKTLLRPAVFIPESKRLDNLLNEFRQSRNHLAIIVDEYGGVSGLVSIEDVLEQIVGDIEDEYDTQEDVYIRLHKDHHYSVKAITPVEEFNEFFGTELNTEEFDTVGGLVLQAFGRLPKRGENITIDGVPFTVTRASNRRISMLQTLLQPQDSQS